MRDDLILAGAALLLAVGTFTFRLAGPLLRARITFPTPAGQLLETTAVTLLAALAATTALTTGHRFTSLATPLGVLAGGLLAWRKAPFFLVVLTAAGTAALLHFLHVP